MYDDTKEKKVRLNFRTGEDKDVKIAKKMWKELFTDTEDEINYFFENLYASENFFLGEDINNKIIASLHTRPYTMIINKIEDPSYYLVGIGVNLEDQGKGYMDEMLKALFLRAKEYEHKDILFLSPIDSSIYKKYGFGYISDLENYYFDTDSTSISASSTDIDCLQITDSTMEDNLLHLADLYANQMKKQFIYLKRDVKYYRNLFREVASENGRIYLFYKNEEPIGYIVFYLKEDTIRVREIIFKEKKDISVAFKMLWNQKNYYKKSYIIGYKDCNYNFYFNDQNKIKKLIQPFIMARIIDPLSIFEKIKNNMLNVKIFVEDNILQQNTGIYELCNNNINFSKDGDADIFIEIQDLPQLIFGYFSVDELIDLGKLQIVSDISLAQLDMMFPKRRSYIQEYE